MRAASVIPTLRTLHISIKKKKKKVLLPPELDAGKGIWRETQSAGTDQRYPLWVIRGVSWPGHPGDSRIL